jgi:hypothetical protein
MKKKAILIIKAKDLADELTIHNIIEKGLCNIAHISQEHFDNRKAIRDILLQRVKDLRSFKNFVSLSIL